MKGNFEKAFSNLREKAADAICVRGSTIVVEIMEEEEIKTEGGIIIASDSDQRRNNVEEHKALIGKVLLVGEGYYDAETKKTEPLEVQVGNIILLPKYSVSYLSVFPALNGLTQNKIALVKEDQILMYFRGQDGYERAKAALN